MIFHSAISESCIRTRKAIYWPGMGQLVLCAACSFKVHIIIPRGRKKEDILRPCVYHGKDIDVASRLGGYPAVCIDTAHIHDKCFQNETMKIRAEIA